MKGIVLAVIFLTLVIFGGLYFFPLNKNLNSPNKLSDLIRKPSPSPDIAINIPKDCNGEATPNSIEGPYYKEGSPQRTELREKRITGDKFVLTGYVFDINCNPVVGAWVDFWQADANGEYDNVNYQLRGHQFTDAQGRYYLETVVPGQYTTRTPHIHVKVQPTESSPIVTAQLYFPGNTRNAEDPIFDQATLVKVEDAQNGKIGTYNFVVVTNQ